MNTPMQASRFWQAHVKALAVSGFSRREYCRRHNLSYHALTYWVRKQGVTPVNPPLALVEVPVAPSVPWRSGDAALRLHLGGGRMIEIDSDFDAAALARVLTVLAQQR